MESEIEILNSTLTRTQEECTKLLLEKRELLHQLEESQQMCIRAQAKWEYYMNLELQRRSEQ